MKSLLLFVLMGFTIQVRAESADSKDPPYHIPAIMKNFMVHIVHLQPYLSSEAEFKKEQNEEMLHEGIDELLASAKAIKSERSLQVPNYMISTQAITGQIQLGFDLFKQDKKEQARRTLLAVPAMCIQCHMQGGGFIREVFSTHPDDLKGTALEKAEYLYATRNFDQAFKMYDQALKEIQTGRSPEAADLREKIFHRKLSYWVRIKRDFNGAEADLQKMKKLTALPNPQKVRIDAWIKAVQAMKVDSKVEPKIESLLQKSESVFGSGGQIQDAQLPRAFWLAGLLSDHLIHQPKAANTAQVLYWSAKADRALAGNSVFTTAQLLFKECAEKFANEPIAARCKAELKP
jgi:tetratricopeptide (TPR) repeat protein